jgi:hypothetical protein
LQIIGRNFIVIKLVQCNGSDVYSGDTRLESRS